jgi:hypothetical protein
MNDAKYIGMDVHTATISVAVLRRHPFTIDSLPHPACALREL